MSEPAPEDCCSKSTVSVEENRPQSQDGAEGCDCAINLDLNQKQSSECQSITPDDDGLNDSEEDLIKKGKFQTARDNLKKIKNSLVMSKIDVLGRVHKLGGKKKSPEKEDNKKKRLSFTKKVEHSSTSQTQENMTNEMVVVTDGRNNDDPTQSPLIVLDDMVDSSSGGLINANSLVTSVGNNTSSNDLSQMTVNECSVPPQSNDLVDLTIGTSLVEQSTPQPQLQNTSSQQKLDEGNYHHDSTGDQGVHVTENIPPISSTQKCAKSVKSTSSSYSSINRGCLEGVGAAVPVDFLRPVTDLTTIDRDSSDYTRYYIRSTGATLNESPKVDTQKEGHKDELESDCDDPYCHSDEGSISENEEDFWGSEFDDSPYQEDILNETRGYDIDETPDKPLPPKPEKKVFFLRGKSTSSDSSFPDESSSICPPVNINSERHPLPSLPPQPSGLSQNQIKRRLVLESIIGSEKSYLESLERLVKDYEKTVLEFISKPRSHVRQVFVKMREIISHHKMFQIELAECVRVWDEQEKIGNIFTASFSKTMLINAYSVYINNFAAAMDEIRSLQRNRQSFNDFLLKQEKLSFDRLSIFGLMVKPVQRFPQFIMFLQDLIKYTPQTHEDRGALQLALTELENVAYRLNERKRHSEQRFQAYQIVQLLIKQKVQHVFDTWSLDTNTKRRLIRSDNVEQVLQQGDIENKRYKNRQLILMNDHVLCVKAIEKEQSGYKVERYALRWVAKLKDLELKDTAVTPNLQKVGERESGKINVAHQSSQINVAHQSVEAEDDPFHLLLDLHEMVHDHVLLQQITGLVSKLKRSYAGHGLREELIHEISSDLQQMIEIKEEQLRLVSSSSIVLQDNSRSDKPQYILQAQTAAIKQDWCLDFLIAKLALDKSNNQAWDGTSGSDGSDFDAIPAYFIKHVPVDVPKHYTKINCAVPTYLNPRKSTKGLGLKQLWVCSSTPEYGQVSILAAHNSKPALIKSFRACDSEILAVELVPGCGDATKARDFLFSEDTVWLAINKKEILIFPLTSDDGVQHAPLASVKTSLTMISLKFVDEKLFCGSAEGVVIVYFREQGGGWNVSIPETLTFGSSSVKFHFVHDENIWLSSGSRLCQLDISNLQTQTISVLTTNDQSDIDHVVKSGVGVWVSFHDSSVIKLFHLETMENLQEISVGNFVSRINSEKTWSKGEVGKDLTVTCLTVSRGLLWIGTSSGVVLTVPLPRLSGGVPLYRGSPKFSLHAHKGPVRFILLWQCTTDDPDTDTTSSFFSTAEAKENWRYQGRKKRRIEQSEGIKKTSSYDETKHSSVGNELLNDCFQTSSVPPLLPPAGMLEQEKAVELASSNEHTGNTIVSDRQTDAENEMLTAFTDFTVELRNKQRSSIDRRNKVMSLSSDPFQRNLSRFSANLDLLQEEPCEVEVLYKSLLEDGPDIKGCLDAGGAMNAAGTDKLGKRWSSALTTDLTLGGQSRPPSQNILQPAQAQPINDQERQLGSNPQHTSSDLNSSKSPPPPDKSGDTFSPSEQTLSPMKRFRRRLVEKASSNAVVVVSGGNGYCDLDISRKEIKMDDACVLLWIHKFY